MAERTEFLPLTPDVLDSTASATNDISYIQNFVPVIVSASLGGKQNIRLVKRPGYKNRVQSAASGYFFTSGMQWTGNPGTGTAPNTFGGVLVYVADKPGTDLKLYQFDTTESTLGTFATANYRCIAMQETLISSVANLTLNVRLLTSPYTQKILFFPKGGSLTEVTDGDLPSGIVGRGVHMDGYYFFAAGGNVWNTDINNLSSITATSFIAAQSIPDNLVGLAKIGNRIIACGTASIEQFQNVGAASGSPLQRIDNAAIKMGVAHGCAIQEIGEGLLFVSSSRSGIAVHYMSNAGVKKVSTASIDARLAGLAPQAGNQPATGGMYYQAGFNQTQFFFAGVTLIRGVEFAILQNASGSGYAYAPNIDKWFLLVTQWGASTFFTVTGQQVSMDMTGSGTSAWIRYSDAFDSVSQIGYDDVSSNFQLVSTLVTAPISHGTSKRKQYNWLRIMGDKQAVTTNITVSYSDDYGANYTIWGTIDMSAQSKLTRGGQTPNDGRPAVRIFSFSGGSVGPCAIDGVEIGYEVLAT